MEIGRLMILIVATVLVGGWVFLATKYAEAYDVVISSIDPKKYQYPELFCIGFALMKWLKVDSGSKKARKRIKEISEIQGEKYAEYYFYIINGEKWTYAYTIVVMSALLGALGNTPLALLFGVLLAALVIWYLEEVMNDQLEERRNELLADMPQMLSKMTLLINSGMVIREAWKKVAYGGKGKFTKKCKLQFRRYKMESLKQKLIKILRNVVQLKKSGDFPLQ